MTIDKIRNNIVNYLNKDLHFIYNGTRNQIEEFDGKISKVYKYVFIIIDDYGIKRSFSYVDLLIGNLVLCGCKIM